MLRHVTLFPFERELRRIPEFLAADAVAVDVGAHVGLYTAQFAKLSRHVIAIEPNPENAEYLRQLKIGNCTVVEAALSDRVGRGELVIPLIEGACNTGLATVAPDNKLDGMKTRTTPVSFMTLDAVTADLVKPGNRVSFIKIDVEGHELACIAGAEQTIREYRPVLMVEVEVRHGSDVRGLFNRMTDMGYNSRVLIDGDLRAITADNLISLQTAKRSDYINNVLFFPAGFK